MQKQKFEFIAIVACYLVLAAGVSYHAYAYIDPGTGSYLVQVIVASVASFMLFFVKPVTEKIKHLFKKEASPHPEPKNDNDSK